MDTTGGASWRLFFPLNLNYWLLPNSNPLSLVYSLYSIGSFPMHRATGVVELAKIQYGNLLLEKMLRVLNF